MKDKTIRDIFRKFIQEAWLQQKRKIRLVSNGVKNRVAYSWFCGEETFVS